MRSTHAHTTRGRNRLVAVSVGLLLAGGGTIGWAATHQVGPPPAPPATTTAKGATPSPSPSAPTDREAASEEAREAPPSPDVAEAMSASEPAAVRIPAIDVSSPIHGLGLDAQGQLKVPSGERYDEVAWYDGSPTPGEVGPAVLEGHVTGSGHDPSVFFELGDVRAGDVVEVDRADGTTATFEVTEVKKSPKDDFPRIDVYGATRGPELRVITCGGTYDEDARRHLDNIIVFAELVEG
ncbi:class F sortase [Janibacter cremeus]|uniref:class F sortase n=1 Tax=Janibacter cremeus TaxID=1285192 RepID=UPI0023F6D4B4|nr:class F sortase [Janibacter cremeus]WEV77304.1 class F sortase [Janibacter cremeus]